VANQMVQHERLVHGKAFLHLCALRFIDGGSQLSQERNRPEDKVRVDRVAFAVLCH
jgi:hypothetical protein